VGLSVLRYYELRGCFGYLDILLDIFFTGIVDRSTKLSLVNDLTYV
jgi:hypothetical protein